MMKQRASWRRGGGEPVTNNLALAFDGYIAKAYRGANISDVHRQELKRAFYAGCAVVAFELHTGSGTEINNEIRTFMRSDKT